MWPDRLNGQGANSYSVTDNRNLQTDIASARIAINQTTSLHRLPSLQPAPTVTEGTA